jgi:hypothetical protein
MRRVTITVDDGLLRLAKADVAAGRAESVSAWVAAAMQEKARARAELIDDLEDQERSDPTPDRTIGVVSRSLGRSAAWVRKHSGSRARRAG